MSSHTSGYEQRSNLCCISYSRNYDEWSHWIWLTLATRFYRICVHDKQFYTSSHDHTRIHVLHALALWWQFDTSSRQTIPCRYTIWFPVILWNLPTGLWHLLTQYWNPWATNSKLLICTADIFIVIAASISEWELNNRQAKLALPCSSASHYNWHFVWLRALLCSQAILAHTGTFCPYIQYVLELD